MSKYSIIYSSKYAALLFFIITTFSVHAQSIDLNNYQGIQSKGEIPKVIIKNIEKRIAEGEKKNIKKEDSWFEKKAKQRNIIESSFIVSELMLSGEVVFNDTLSNYLQNIAKDLLKNDIETFNKLHFFIVKSSFTNSFCTSDGAIIVTLGLIARLQNEAEVAFVLAREIAHFKSKHSLNLYLDGSKILNTGGYNLKVIQNQLLQKSNYTLEYELAADSMALSILANSPYSSETSDNLFSCYANAEAPLEQKNFDKKFFNTSNFIVPENYFFASVNPLEDGGNYDFTHFDLKTRKTSLQNNFYYLNTRGRNTFVNPPQAFFFMRNICRFEMSSLYLSNRRYAEAIYNSYLLLSEFPNNEFLSTNISNSLYYLAKYNNIHRIADVNSRFENVKGETQQLHLLFTVMKDDEINALAISSLWKNYQMFPSRKDLKKKAEELLIENFRLYGKNNDSYSRQQLPIDSIIADQNRRNFKPRPMMINTYYGYGKRPADSTFINTKHAFASFFSDPEFAIAYDKAVQLKDKPLLNNITYHSAELINYNSPVDQHLHLPKIVMVDPSYFKINNTFFNEKFNAQSSEAARKEYSKMIKDISKKAHLNVELLDSKFINAKQVNTFNDIARLNAFIDELYKHKDLDSVQSVDYELVNMLMQHHQTKYLAWNNVFAITEPDAMSDPVALAFNLVYYFYLAPIFIYDAATPDYYTYHYMMVADIEKGKLIYNKAYMINGKDSQDRIKSILYYNFLQLGNTKAKKN